jgi:hypothetical protein
MLHDLITPFQLFELLGFDRFELIQSLIQNRAKIVRGALSPPEGGKHTSMYRK